MPVTDVHRGSEPSLGGRAPETSPCRAGRSAAFWRSAISRYERPDVGRAAADVATSLVPYLALGVAMYFLLGVSYLLVLALAIPAAGFLLRTYIVFHDC